MKRPSMIRRVRSYLAQRRALGFRLRSEGYVLLSFARYADRHGQNRPLTNKLAIAWARLPPGAPRPRRARHLEAVRRLAQYLHATDPQTELPPRHLFGPSQQPYQPFLYQPQQIAQLLAAALRLPGSLRPYTYQTLLGLLACTGLRVSEALGLKRCDVDLQRGLLLVRQGKFQQTRWVPLHPTALGPLRRYQRQRQRYCPAAEYFFTSESGAPLAYGTVHMVFSRLRRSLATEGHPPRLHDLRHTHACRVLQRWLTSRRGAEGRLLILSRYLGHHHVRHTYWYLHAMPELLASISKQFAPHDHESS